MKVDIYKYVCPFCGEINISCEPMEIVVCDHCGRIFSPSGRVKEVR